MKNLVLTLVFAIVLSFSCEKEQVKIDPDNLILGTWVYSEYEDDAAVYTRDDEFADNQCYRFNADGTLVERKNSGWCGTPPITYGDYEGTWTVINDTLISVSSDSWAGKLTYKLDIEEISPTSLKVIYIHER